MKNQRDLAIKIQILILGLDELESEIHKNHLTNENKIFDLVNDTIFKFFYLTLALKESQKDKKAVYLLGYLTAITNNTIVIKHLFSRGWHLQLQIIMRSQFEHLNVLLSFICDEDLFEKFSTLEVIPNQLLPLTPKQVHCNKIVKKVFSKSTKYLEFWPIIEESIDYLYDEFSKSTHGNLLQVSLLSMQNDDKGNKFPALGGSEYPFVRTKNMAIEMNNYSQFVWYVIMNKLTEKGLIIGDDIDTPLAIISPYNQK